ncbi:MAG TPA: SRPBCC family protein [Longimicrobiaceae bacterium]|nr:SRPBCC family protein [Longimicrobiaceae bacterium]
MSATHTPAAQGAARTFEVAVTHRIAAPAEAVYGVFADYREAHPRIVPPSFFVGMSVEQGGYGAGTIVLVHGRFAGRTRTIRGVVTEPEPGRLLVESYPAERMVTSFRVLPEPGGTASLVTISTVMPRRWGPVGWIEERIVRRLLGRVFAEELELVAAYLAGVGVPAGAAASAGAVRAW